MVVANLPGWLLISGPEISRAGRQVSGTGDYVL
jgi:hypothetical protein